MALPGFTDQGTKSRRNASSSSASKVVFWGDSPDTWDQVVLAGKTLPGICLLKGKGFEQRCQHKSVPGKHGERVTFIGNEPAEWEVHIQLLTPDHLDSMCRIIDVLKPRAKPKAKPLNSQADQDANADVFLSAFGPGIPDELKTTLKQAITAQQENKDVAPSFFAISHPALAMFRISYCRVMAISLPEQVQDKGIWEIKLKCREHVLDGSRDATVATSGGGQFSLTNLGPGVVGQQVIDYRAQRPSKTSTGPAIPFSLRAP